MLIGELFTGIGEISIVINNRTGAVEWVDCEYGQYEEYEKNPHGVLADHMDSFLQKLTGKTAGKAGKHAPDRWTDSLNTFQIRIRAIP